MTDPQAQMALLRERFLLRARADRAAIMAALDAGDRDRLLRLAHGLAGIAGIFGHADVGARASVLEDAVEAGEAGAALMAKARALADALDAVAGGG